MGRISFIRVYPSDWRSGCLGLSFEQEGLYIRICMFQAEANRRVPLDDSQAARMLGANLNQYRKVLGQLLVLGKITRHEDGYGNHRIEHERREAAKANHRKPAAAPQNGADRETNSGCDGEDYETPLATPQATRVATPQATPPVHAENRQQNQRPSIEPESEPRTIVVDDNARAGEVADRQQLASAMKRITDAAKPILKDGGMSAGLMGTASEISKWLNAGCDVDADVLPIIEAAVAKGATVNSWKFFSPSIVAAKASREAPLPAAPVSRATFKPRAPSLTVADVFRRQLAEQAARNGVAS